MMKYNFPTIATISVEYPEEAAINQAFHMQILDIIKGCIESSSAKFLRPIYDFCWINQPRNLNQRTYLIQNSAKFKIYLLH